jgi:hypothetical protein
VKVATVDEALAFVRKFFAEQREECIDSVRRSISGLTEAEAEEAIENWTAAVDESMVPQLKDIESWIRRGGETLQ